MSTFNHEGNYICECGKQFINANSFNGHKCHCKVHQIAKHGSLDYIENVKINNAKKVSEGFAIKRVEYNQQKHLIWVSEKHVCEKCGKVMIEKFGSGRFCSRSCANSREKSSEVKEKISKSVSKTRKPKSNKLCKCIICGADITTNKKKKTCSKKCRNILRSINAKKHGLGTTQGHCNKGIKKEINGFMLESSYEIKLAENLNANNVNWIRPKYLNYIDNEGIQHKYYPDFYLPDYNIYLDPKNDFLIDGITKDKKYSDCQKIEWVMQQNKVKILILRYNQLDFNIIKDLF